MRNAAVDYAIPRSKLAAAKARDNKFNSTEAVAELVEQAKRSFTDLAKSGEGGEMLLFLLAERFLKLPQVLCKMELYWGESKIYGDASAAIRDCLNSLSPFLIEPEHEEAGRERDLVLLSDKADLSNPTLTDALKKYFDKSSVMSKRVQYCGVALVGFDAPFYPKDDVKAVAEEIVKASRTELSGWSKSIESRLKAEKLDQMEIELLCIPLPSAEGFRTAFFKAMGIKE